MKRTFVILLMTCMAFFKANAQGDLKKRYGIPGLAALHVGNRIPDFTIPKLINPKQKDLKISDFNDRLVIIDFWNTSCASCIEALPHMDALQKQFGTRIKILPANFQPADYVADFWKTNKHTRNLKIPSVVEDKILMSYFPFVGVPHEVWIYKGVVVAITFADAVNAVNIEEVLSGKVINWPVKDDFYVFDGRKKPLFALDSSQVDANTGFLKYAAIGDYMENVGIGIAGDGKVREGIVRDQAKKSIRYFYVNPPSIYSFYLSAWLISGGGKKIGIMNIPGGNILNPATVVWEVADKSRYVRDSRTTIDEATWMKRNSLCFESVQPDIGQTDQQVYESVLIDLNRLLGLNVRWEKRKEKVLVLLRTDTIDRLKTVKPVPAKKPPEDVHVYIDRSNAWRLRKNDTEIKLRDYVGFAGFITNGIMKAKGQYVFDETGYKGNVDMDLNISSWTDIDGIRKAIKPYGLDLKEEERLVDKLVFTEINGGLLVDGPMQIAAQAKRATQKGMADPSSAENKAFLALNKRKPGVVTLPSGVQYQLIKKGAGAKPVLNDNIIVHYTGTLVNGKIFTSSYESGRPLNIKLSETIKGWQEVLPLIPIGTKVILYIPAELAYGEHTGQGRYPQYSNMIFEIELLQIVK